MNEGFDPNNNMNYLKFGCVSHKDYIKLLKNIQGKNIFAFTSKDNNIILKFLNVNGYSPYNIIGINADNEIIDFMILIDPPVGFINRFKLDNELSFSMEFIVNNDFEFKINEIFEIKISGIRFPSSNLGRPAFKKMGLSYWP